MDPLLTALGIPNSKLEILADTEETDIKVQAESGGEMIEEQGVGKKGQEVKVELEEWEEVEPPEEAEVELPEGEEVGLPEGEEVGLPEGAEVELQKEAEAMKEEEVRVKEKRKRETGTEQREKDLKKKMQKFKRFQNKL